MLKKIFVLILIFISSAFAQEIVIDGIVKNSVTKEPLSFANVRVMGTSSGTSANIEGEYEIRLKSEDVSLIASYIGFKSDTVFVAAGKTKINFLLQPISIELPQITVTPGINPAIELIKRTVDSKNNRNNILTSYIVDAYTKGVVRTTSDISSSGGGISIGLSSGNDDTSDLQISGILENTSRSFYLKPDYYKDNILAQKQSANFPSQINVFTGGRLIQNFYTDDIQFAGSQITSPIADNATEYYYYLITDTLAYDNHRVIEVECEPVDESDPGFIGKLYIIDSLYALAKVDLTLNDAANPGGLFKELKVLQQFQIYDNISMPVDYRLTGRIEFLNLVKLGFDLSSILYNYEINAQIDDDVFGMAFITVMPDAEKKDSIYWSSIQSIPNTLDELNAYQRIDSLESIPKSFWDNFDLLSARIPFGGNISIAGPLWMYSFNRVEGNTLQQGIYLNGLADRRFYSSLDFGYGFSDKKFKADLRMNYNLGEYRTMRIDFAAFDKLDILFGESDSYNTLTSTLTNLIGKYDFRDYYYTKGFRFGISSDVLPVLRLNAGFLNRTDNSAVKNSDFSIFNKSKTYSDNPPINNVKINALTAGFQIDFRKYIEDGYYRRRSSLGNSFVILSGDVLLSKKDLLKSGLEFEIYNLDLYGNINSFRTTSIDFNIKAVNSSGPVPLQMLYALPGNISGAGKSSTFRTLRTSEIYGDKVVTLNLDYNLGDELFRVLNIPFLEDSRIILNPYVNAAWVELSDKSKNYIPAPYTEFKNPLVEIGFGIGHMLFPIILEFTWRVNHRTGNNFVVGINTFVL